MLYNFNGENTVSLDMMNQIGVSLFLYQNNSLTAVFLSGISKLAKFEIFQASNFFYLIIFFVDFLEPNLSITHSHQLGLLSGSGFITWQTVIRF